MEKLTVAKITKPQGIKGDLKIALFVRDLDLQGMQVFVEENEHVVENIYAVGNGYAIKLSGVLSVSDAESYRGKTIEIDKDKLIVPKDKYLVADLLGKTAMLASGKVVGQIASIDNFGAADVITIKANKEILCSHKKGLIVKIEGQKVVLDDKIFAEVAVYEN